VNIFVLSKDPVLAAQYQADVHVVKMSLETAQLLSTASIALFPSTILPANIYKPSHINHPCTLWAQESYTNFRWLCIHGLSLCREYTYRYSKIHGSKRVIQSLYSLCRNAPIDSQTRFALAMPDEFKTDDEVLAYRSYYAYKKKTLPRFNYTNRTLPEWLL